MFSEKFTFCFKITIKWNLSKLHATRIGNFLGISALTGKRVAGDDDSAIKEHLSFCNHTPEFEDFSILATNNNDFKVTLMESLLINRDHSPLNKNKQSLPLDLLIARN